MIGIVATTYFPAETSVVGQSCGSTILGFAVGVVRLGEDYDTLSGDVVLFEEFAEDDFGFTGRVHIGSVKGLFPYTSFSHHT